MNPPFVHQYLQNGLGAPPVVLRALVGAIPPDDAKWDARPQADRFSLREIVAHLADWEAIWLERIEQALSEDCPEMGATDPGQIAIERDYAHANPLASIERFATGRQALAERIASLNEDQWRRMITRAGVGTLAVEALVSLIVSHDGYHLRQVVEWLG